MSVAYQAVGWDAFKKHFDQVVVGGVVAFLGIFVGVGLAVHPAITAEILMMRATSVASFMLLHLILAIGPLARINSFWLPLLYNRRHLGVTMFLLALAHSIIAVITYHVAGPINPFVSIFATDAGTRMSAFPFQAFGFGALMILFIMAATSHDFWLANLTAPVWKTLHMLVYLAYALLVVHVAFGVLQAEKSPVYALLIVTGVVTIGGLHLVAGWRQRELDQQFERASSEGGFVDVCEASELTENVPFGAAIAGERVAIVLYERNKISCVSGVCQHQNGPLAEGRFKYGCLTCPWHGYQYKPEDGTSPEPFTEKIPTFDVKVVEGRVLVKRQPNPAGTPVEPARWIKD